jgi:hypothetical protein
MWAVNNDATSFDALTQACQSTAHEINLQQEAKTTSRTRPTTTGGGSGSAAVASEPYIPRVKRKGTASSALLPTKC